MTFRELIEMKIPRTHKFISFDININGKSEFSHENADVIERKLKTGKFKKEIQNIKIIRHTDNSSEDVTKLFI